MDKILDLFEFILAVFVKFFVTIFVFVRNGFALNSVEENGYINLEDIESDELENQKS